MLMEKGALLPIRFYPSLEWTDYKKMLKYGGDIAIVREHNLFAPAFQLTLPDEGRHWGLNDFYPFGLEIVNYDTGDIEFLAGWANRKPTMYIKAGEFRSFVWFRFPLSQAVPPKLPEGKYYYHIQDERSYGDDNGDWYSEVFQLCDFGTNAITEEFGDDANWANFLSSWGPNGELANAQFCKSATGAGDATAYMDLEVMLGEEIDIYIRTEDNTAHGGCAVGQWASSLFLELREPEYGGRVSETLEISTTDSYYTFSLKSEMSGTVRLYMYVLDADAGKGNFYIYIQRRYTEGNIQLRYSNSTNFCKIFYEDGYENVFFLDAKQVIDENAIEETVTEDDQTNKYRIIGTNKKWNDFQMVSGEAMLNAMSLLRLHDNIKIIKETGEVMDVAELLMEQAILSYEASQIKLVYREDSCSVEACGFEICCPTPGTPAMEEVYNAPGSLPACNASRDEDYAMVLTAADEYRIYYCNGAAWAVNTDYDIAGYCVEARQNNMLLPPLFLGNRFFWYDTGVSRWRIFIDLASVTDNADGTANLVTDTEYYNVTVRGEYYDGEWIKCTDPLALVAGGGAKTLVCDCGVGTFDFRLHIYTDNCDYGYSNIVAQTIT